ncbi:hypothetical protein F4859DRAFT_477503 [Xylaria cf. heliscus]|nr:hypothetical protein F4859DRAFT_477503 [Xylaria cf. heliscus]
MANHFLLNAFSSPNLVLVQLEYVPSPQARPLKFEAKMSTVDTDNLPNLLYALSIVFVALPIIIVALRFQVKFKSNPRIFWDDWNILLALLSCIIYAVFVIIGVAAGGLGRPLKRDVEGEPIYDDTFFIFQRVSYVTNAIQILALGPTKLAVLLFYRRIFSVEGRVERRGFNIISLTLMVLVIVWTVSFFFTNIFTYTPVSDMWTKPPGKAHHTFEHATRMYNAQCFADMALDAIIITLPLPQIWKLQMTTRLKIQISGLFLLGLITIGASAARSVIQYGVAEEFDTGNPDQTYYLARGIYWALIEVSLGIVAASLPLLRPVAQIYSIRKLLLLSSKMLSTIFTTSNLKSSQSAPGDSSKGDIESGPQYSHDESSQNNKWVKAYDISCLQQTIDNETQIESNPTSSLDETHVGYGIRCEKGYKVVHTSNETGQH